MWWKSSSVTISTCVVGSLGRGLQGSKLLGVTGFWSGSTHWLSSTVLPFRCDIHHPPTASLASLLSTSHWVSHNICSMQKILRTSSKLQVTDCSQVWAPFHVFSIFLGEELIGFCPFFLLQFLAFSLLLSMFLCSSRSWTFDSLYIARIFLQLLLSASITGQQKPEFLCDQSSCIARFCFMFVFVAFLKKSLASIL